MLRTTFLVAAFLLTGLAIQAVPTDAQTPHILPGGGEQQAAPLASVARLFPVSPAFSSAALGIEHGREPAERAPCFELPMVLPSVQEAQDPDRELKKYVGVGLMVIRGINTLHGLNCVATAHAWGNACWPYLGVSVSIGVGG